MTVWPFTGGAERRPSRVGRLVYAVGDVHGRSDLLDLLLSKITADARAHAELHPVVVFLGDYIDRGGDSAGVLERLASLARSAELDVAPLMGNHEDLLLRFLRGEPVGPRWVSYGGGAALQSYGVPTPRIDADGEAWNEARLRLTAAMPPSHRRLLDGLPMFAEFGDYLFVHAGVRPGVPLEDQVEQDLLTIRRPFLRARKACGRVVVHGHTPAKEVHLGHHRIGVDTGAFATGILSAVRLYGTTRETMQVDGG